jgi:hypothetical protein
MARLPWRAAIVATRAAALGESEMSAVSVMKPR